MLPKIGRVLFWIVVLVAVVVAIGRYEVLLRLEGERSRVAISLVEGSPLLLVSNRLEIIGRRWTEAEWGALRFRGDGGGALVYSVGVMIVRIVEEERCVKRVIIEKVEYR